MFVIYPNIVFDTILRIATIVKYFVISCLFLFCSILAEEFFAYNCFIICYRYSINLTFLKHCFLLDEIQIF